MQEKEQVAEIRVEQVGELQELVPDQSVRGVNEASIVAHERLGGDERTEQVVPSGVGQVGHGRTVATILFDAAADLGGQRRRRYDRKLVQPCRRETVQDVAHDRPVGDPACGGRVIRRSAGCPLRGNNDDSLAPHGDTTETHPACSRASVLYSDVNHPPSC